MVSLYDILIVGISDFGSSVQGDLGRVRLVAIECRRAYSCSVRNNPCSNQNLRGNRCDTPKTCAVMSVNYGMVRDGIKCLLSHATTVLRGPKIQIPGGIGRETDIGRSRRILGARPLIRLQTRPNTVNQSAVCESMPNWWVPNDRNVVSLDAQPSAISS
jgi:hypothetical protein